MKRTLQAIAMCWLLLASMPVSADDYGDEWQVAANALVVAGWSQTRYIAGHPDEYYERDNQVLSKHPSKKEVDLYFVGSLVVVNVVGELILNADYREVFYQVITVVQVGAVGNNASIGIGMDIGF